MIAHKLQIAIALLALAIFAMGSYLVHLERKAESVAEPPPLATLTPLPSGPAEQIVLLVAHDEDDSLRPVTVALALPGDAGQRGQLALHTLITRYQQPDSPHPLGSGADVREVYLLDGSSAVVDLNAAFADAHRSGVEVEQLSIFSLVLSLKSQFPTLTRVRFLVDGKSRETLAGHFDLSDWVEVARVADAARQQIATEQH
jgi:sporulation and spore germination protein